MNIDQGHQLLDVMTHASAATVRATFIGVGLIIVGSPLSLLFSERLGKPTVAFASVCGLFILTIFSWYAFRFGVNVNGGYLALIITGVIVSSAVFARAAFKGGIQQTVPQYSRLAIEAGASFVIPVFLYSCFCFMKMRAGGLALLSTGNNDLFSYVKFGGILSALPAANTWVSAGEVTPTLTRDVFAAMNLESFSSFILQIGIDRCAIPVFGFAVGLIAVGVVTICQRSFELPVWAGIILALVLTTSTLFTYLILNYFLAQLLFQGILLATIFYIAEIANKRYGAIRRATVAVMIGSVCVMFSYPSWFVQYMFLAAAGVFLAMLLAHRSLTVRAAGMGVLVSIALLTAINCIDFIASPARYVATAGYLVGAASTALAGWPLPFIDLKLLLAIPGRWPPDSGRGGMTAFGILPESIIFIVASVFYWKNDREDGSGSRRFLLICLATTIILYLFAWVLYGESYRQWKFATTLSLPLCFVLAACFLFALPRAHFRLGKIFRTAGFIVLLLFIICNIAYLQTTTAPAIPLPAGLEQVAAANNDRKASAVYIDLPDYSQRMAAAIFVNQKPIFFSGDTYYGPAAKLDDLPEGIIAVFRETCTSNDQVPAYELVDLAKSDVMLRRIASPANISFAGQDSKCIRISGFSGGEDWGRWTDSNSASITLRYYCDLSKQKASITLNAATFLSAGKVDQQRVVFRVNGSPPQERIIVSTEKKAITLGVTPEKGDPSLVYIQIEMPDAVSPAIDGSSDTRLLGLAISSLVLAND